MVNLNNLNEFKSEIKNDTINDKKVNDELLNNSDAIEKILYQLILVQQFDNK